MIKVVVIAIIIGLVFTSGCFIPEIPKFNVQPINVPIQKTNMQIIDKTAPPTPSQNMTNVTPTTRPPYVFV
jgi:hypothetical protein